VIAIRPSPTAGGPGGGGRPGPGTPMLIDQVAGVRLSALLCIGACCGSNSGDGFGEISRKALLPVVWPTGRQWADAFLCFPLLLFQSALHGVLATFLEPQIAAQVRSHVRHGRAP